MTTQQDTHVNVLSYLRIFFRRKYFLIIPLLLGLLVSFFVANVSPKVYEAYTVILIEEDKLDNPIISGLAVSRSARQRLRNLRDQILGWNRLVKLAEKLDLIKDIKDQRELEGLILGDLRQNIHVSMRGPSLLRIGYRAESPKVTQIVVKTISEIFVEENVIAQNKESDIAISFLEEQLKVYQRKIKDSEIAELEDRLDVLLLDSTEAHPMVRDLKSKIANAKENMVNNQDAIIENPEFIKDPVYEKIKTSLESEITTMKASTVIGEDASLKDNAATEGDIYKVALMSNITKALSRDLSINQKIYNKLLERLETAKISRRLEASKEGTRYTILDPPRIPLSPIKPNRVLIMLIGSLIGVAVGFGLIVLLEVIDNSFLEVEEVKAILGLPVLGAISKIVTAKDLAQEKAKRAAQFWTVLITSITFVSIVIVYTITHKP
ncbi:GNVR domain-containing protein [Candidatus Omnitrophota bacterium]